MVCVHTVEHVKENWPLVTMYNVLLLRQWNQVVRDSFMTVSDPWLIIPKRPMRSREKLLGDWSFGEDGGDIVSMLVSNK